MEEENDRSERSCIKGKTMKYNAFISYRHTPRDIEVAEELQKQLERFPIPKELQKKYGIRRIERIFRDKSELPTTSSLTDDIENALRESDFLLVICSPDTKESRWIEREISLFLEHHDQDHVLTVLSAGEPMDVIPERLLKRTRRIRQEDGTELEITDDIEPLSCDYRMPFRQARKTELPRLLAVMIGCSYDELMRRRHQYTVRRYAAAASIITLALSVFIAHLIYSRKEIQKNYELAQKNLDQSRINQSLYLSASSLEALEKHDRITAAHLALAAMPENSDRPLVSEAMYALSSSLGLYHNSDRNEYTAVRQFETDGILSSLWVSPDAKTMVCFDQTSMLYFFDLAQNKERITVPCPSPCYIYPTKSGLFLLSSTGVSLLSWKTGEPVWSKEMPLRSYYHHFDPGASILACSTEDGFVWFSEDGTHDGKMLYQDLPVLNSSYMQSRCFAFPERSLALISVQEDESDPSSLEQIVVHHTDTGHSELLPGSFHAVEDIRSLKDGNLLIFENETDFMEGTTSFTNMTLYSDMTVVLSCFNPDSGSRIWQNRLSYTLGSSADLRLFSGAEDRELLLASLANLQFIIDTTTGTVLHRSEWPAVVCDVINMNASSVLSVLDNGGFALCYPDGSSKDALSTLLIPDILTAKRAKPYDNDQVSFLAVPKKSGRIIQFDSGVKSPVYQTLFPTGTKIIQSFSTDEEDLMAIQSLDYPDQFIDLYDLSSDQKLLSEPVSADPSAKGFLSDQRFIYVDRSGSDTLLVTLDPFHNERRQEVIFTIQDGSQFHCALDQDDLFMVSFTPEKEFCVKRRNPVTQEAKEHTVPLPQDLSKDYFISGLIPYPDHEEVLILLQNQNDQGQKVILTLKDTDSSASPVLSFSDKSPFYVSVDPNGFALRTPEGIEVHGRDGTLITSIPCNTRNIASFCLHEGNLYLFSVDGILSCIDESGALLKTYTGSAVSAAARDQDSSNWRFLEDQLYLFTGSCIQRFSLNQSVRDLCADNAFWYDQKRNRLLVNEGSSSEAKEIGCFQVCSPEEMAERAKIITDPYPLEDTVKERYGIK